MFMVVFGEFFFLCMLHFGDEFFFFFVYATLRVLSETLDLVGWYMYGVSGFWPVKG